MIVTLRRDLPTVNPQAPQGLRVSGAAARLQGAGILSGEQQRRGKNCRGGEGEGKKIFHFLGEGRLGGGCLLLLYYTTASLQHRVLNLL